MKSGKALDGKVNIFLFSGDHTGFAPESRQPMPLPGIVSFHRVRLILALIMSIFRQHRATAYLRNQ
jgi:hypothetical protein